MKRILFIILSIICFSFASDVQKKVIRDQEYDIECYISSKNVSNFNTNKMYYWYKSGEVHKSVSSSGGYVLHKSFTKYYKDNQLAEQGEFDYGLKHGVWKTWHPNGLIKTKAYWDNGYQYGNYNAYDSTGNLIISGSYKKNIKHGKWIDFVKKDTFFYNNNALLKEKPVSLFERIVRKKDSLEKVQRKQDRILKRRQDSLKKVENKLQRLSKRRLDSIERSKKPKKGFLKNLFKDKE